MSHPRRAVLVILLLLAALLPDQIAAQQGTIEDIRVQGLFRMRPEALLHVLGVKPGDPYDEDLLRKSFKTLWRGRWFQDLVFEIETGPQGGTVLIIKAKERPVLSAVTYEDNSVATRTAIEDRLRERNVELQLGKPLDMGQVFFAATAIRDLMSEKGFLNAEVESQVRTVTETTRAVHFFITSGGKTRIKKIEFAGNEIFKDKKLKGQLQLTQERQWYWPWSAKNLYHPVKWDQDAGNVRQLYLNNGYLDVEVRTPIVEVVQKGGQKNGDEQAQEQSAEQPVVQEDADQPPIEELTPKQQKKLAKQQNKEAEKRRKQEKKEKKVNRMVYLTVPVVEGSQYTLGEITVTGSQELPAGVVRAMIPLQDGDTLRNDYLEAGIDRVTRLYEDRGHLYASVVRQIQRREGENVADVAVTVDEDKPYYIGRIEFVGNTATKDAVLRREVLVNEGGLFSRTALDLSQRKLNQLGYWQAPEEPVIQPIEGENRVDVTVAGLEQGRNEIQVGGGYSGVDGAFFNGVYSTRNFLGRGQIVSLNLQIGGRTTRYQLSFQEPWLFNKPYSFGFSLFRTTQDFGASLNSQSTGFGLLLGKRLGRFSNIDFRYNFQSVSSTTVLTTFESAISDQTTSITNNTDVSSITPIYRFSTIDNPYRPSRGRNFTASVQLAGGILGGDTNFIKPVLNLTQYRRAIGKSRLAFHAQGGFIREIGNETSVSGSDIEGVPRFERFWLGGDTLGPRVFETRSITPLRYVVLDGNRIVDVVGDPRFISADELVNNGVGIPVLVEVGGDRFYLFQTEYIFAMNEQIEIAAFLDVGDALFEDQSINLDTIRASAGFEVRFHLPIFPVPLRLIYGWPVRSLERDQTSNFTFSIGRSF
jgi:outer membrane protein insertion porin family